MIKNMDIGINMSSDISEDLANVTNIMQNTISHQVLCRYRSKWNIDLKLKPFFLGAVMKGSDNRPPMMVPAKGKYMSEDLRRLRKFYQIPIKPPANPVETMVTKGTLKSQRFLTAVTLQEPGFTEAVSRELWSRIWSRDEDITTPESLTAIGKKVGLSDGQIASLIKSSDGAAVKDRLKALTQEALDLGAFGAPIIVLLDEKQKKQMIFGSDRMELIASMLGEKYEGPLNELAASKL